MIKQFLIFSPLLASAAMADKINNVTQSDLSAVVSTVDGNTLTMDNMRLKSNQTDLNDYVRGTFRFDRDKLTFKPTNFKIYENVGVFSDWYFARDVAKPMVAKRGGEIYQAETNYQISGTAVFKLDLVVGHVFTCLIQNPSKEYLMELLDPDGKVIDSGRGELGGGVISGKIPILRAGTYLFKLRPTDASNAISYSWTFANSNRQSLETFKNGSNFSFGFLTNLFDYGKMRIRLEKGEILRLPAPSSDLIDVKILNSKSVVVNEVSAGLPSIYKAPETGLYYVFCNNKNGWGGSYSGTVNITDATPLSPPANPTE